MATVQLVGSSARRVRRADEDRPARRTDRAGRVGRRQRLVDGQERVDDEPQVGLGREDRQGRVVEPRRHDDLEEDRDERLRDRRVHRPGQRHDPTERRDRIARQRRLPRLEERQALRRAARVGVLDDDAARAAERTPQRGRSRGVEDVVVGQRLALQRRLAGRERAVGGGTPRTPVAGRRLVRVLAVAERVDLLEADGEARRVRIGRRIDQPGRGHPPGECLGDPGVVRRGVREGFEREFAPHAVIGTARRPRAPRGCRRSGPGRSRSPRWRGSSRPPGPSTGRRCRSPR